MTDHGSRAPLSLPRPERVPRGDTILHRGPAEAEVTDRAGPILIVTAMPRECEAVLKTVRIRTRRDGAGGRVYACLYREETIVVSQAGVGPDRAARATGMLIAEHSPSVVISVGCAGALRPWLKTGDVVVGSRVDFDGDDRSDSELDPALVARALRALNDAGIVCHAGAVTTVRSPVFATDERAALAGKYDSIVVEMETAAVAQAAREAGVPIISLRCVLDEMGHDLGAWLGWTNASAGRRLSFADRVQRKVGMLSGRLKLRGLWGRCRPSISRALPLVLHEYIHGKSATAPIAEKST